MKARSSWQSVYFGIWWCPLPGDGALGEASGGALTHIWGVGELRHQAVVPDSSQAQESTLNLDAGNIPPRSHIISRVLQLKFQ